MDVSKFGLSLVVSLYLLASSTSVAAASELDRLLSVEEVQASFSQQYEVFGVPLIATKKTPDKSVKHALAVLRGYLDNDRDGKPDNPAVVDALIINNGAMVLGKHEDDLEDAFDELIEIMEEQDFDVDTIEPHLISLMANEINPSNGFDASLEEILHLITHVGYANAYPEAWGLHAGSQLAKAMDKARGGKFKRIPSRYPNSAWFTYEDNECDYECQMVEYAYWGITTHMGIQASRGQAIKDEWHLASINQFKAKDKLLLALITDPRYLIPQNHPLP